MWDNITYLKTNLNIKKAIVVGKYSVVLAYRSFKYFEPTLMWFK